MGAAVAALLFSCGNPPAGEIPVPNLVLIVADDVGYGDFGFMGSPHVRTPHLDRLAERGTVFSNGYSAANVCVPALRSLLTGLHPIQWQQRVDLLREAGTSRPRGHSLRDFQTLPRLLGQHGYASFQAGKLWEASHAVAGFSDGMQKPGDSMARGGSGIELGRSTTAPVDDFLAKHADRPFFLWFAPRLPHGPHDAPQRFREPYAEAGLSPAALAYYSNVTRFDDVIGQLLSRLDELELRERTLIVYVADNGWDQEPRAMRGMGFDGPRGKLTIYDLGFRTPIILSWPGRVPAGKVREELVSSVDLFPTLLDYAGVPIPEPLPGHSLRPLLEGCSPWPRDAVIAGASQLRDRTGTGLAFFVRTDQWRYIWDRDRDTEALYAIRDDPREQRNLAGQQPERVAALRRRIEDWRAELERQVEAGASTP